MGYRAADLFCGGGGFHLAMNKVDNFDVVFACERDKKIAKVYEDNFGINPLGDMYSLDEGVIKSLGELDIVTAGFPCQPFSFTGYRQGFNDNLNGAGFAATRDFINISKPKTFVCENVLGLTSKRFKETFEFILYEFDRVGYNVKWEILKSCEFGAPQIRKRVYIVGVRKDINFTYEFPEKGDCSLVKLKDILNDNVSLEWYIDKEYADVRLALSAKLGNTLTKRTSALGWKIYEKEDILWGITCNFYDKTQLNVISDPSDLVLPYVRDRKINEYFLRSLTRDEYLKLQGFPLCYKHNCTKTLFSKIIGNAITVPVASSVIQNLIPALH